MIWQKVKININNKLVNATEPIIISASRATDIPALYSKWLIDKFQKGYLAKNNPFSGKLEYISLRKARVIVFWSKNPKPLIKYLNFFDKQKINYYFLITLNYYPEYELNLPPIEHRIKTFQQLSKLIGRERVLWRFDPLIISDKIDEYELIKRIKLVGDEISQYTERLIFSFVELSYKKVQNNLKKYNAIFYEPSENQINYIISNLLKLTKHWKVEPRSCASKYDFSKFGIKPNKCIDDELMVRLFNHDKILMNFLGYNSITPYKSNPKLKDKGQRPYCGCIYSKDIGRYNTCVHHCIYCYANTSYETALKNFKLHNPSSLKI